MIKARFSHNIYIHIDEWKSMISLVDPTSQVITTTDDVRGRHNMIQYDKSKWNISLFSTDICELKQYWHPYLHPTKLRNVKIWFPWWGTHHNWLQQLMQFLAQESLRYDSKWQVEIELILRCALNLRKRHMLYRIQFSHMSALHNHICFPISPVESCASTLGK